MREVVTGWLLDLYADAQDGLVLWLLEEGAPDQAAGRRLRLKQPFPVTFYAAGPNAQLRDLWRYLQAQGAQPDLARGERRDLFQDEPVTVLAVSVQNPARQARQFYRAARRFPELTYYDADIPLALRHAAAYKTFPLAKVQATIDEQGIMRKLSVLDSPWETAPQAPPLRIMRIEPDKDPHHAPPRWLHIRTVRRSYRLSLEPVRPLLINLGAILRRHDPDLLLTGWGDTWLLPHLLEQCEKTGLDIPLNRDATQSVLRKPERTYYAYGQVIHRGQQVQLYGRWHIDIYNAVMFHDYGLEGILESARVTGLPVQQAARLSPGTGISAMQITTALRQKVLVPWHKQQVEHTKSALDLFQADQGGMVYQPLIGLHRDVAEIDFVSMYPSIMAWFNVSPETVVEEQASAAQVPELGLWIDQGTPGLVPQTLRPLLDKRIELKGKIAQLDRRDPRRRLYKVMASAHKWLLVTCFGYLGYKNARFGQIEAHQAVTAYSRECLLRAKEAAEEAGFTVLHMYVDGLWVQKAGCKRVEDVQPLMDEILKRTRLPIALEGVYRWVAFLPSRVNERVPVPNRYFGVFQDGSLKVRGIEIRRQDTPPFIAQMQMEILEQLASVEDTAQLRGQLRQITAYLRQQIRLLRAGKAPIEQLLVTQKLSRELELYRVPSPVAIAAAQLKEAGKHTRPGQYVRFLYTLGKPGVHAWNLPKAPNYASLDIPRYMRLLLRAASTVLQPLGVSEDLLRDWLFSHASYGSQPGELPAPMAAEMPLFAGRTPLPMHRDPNKKPPTSGSSRDLGREESKEAVSVIV